MRDVKRMLGLVVVTALVACAAGETGSLPSHDQVNEVRDLSAFFEGLEGTFVLWDVESGRMIRHHPERAGLRFLPASTFKIVNALIALDAGVAPGESYALSWDSTDVSREFLLSDAHTQDQTLRSAFQGSIVWYYRDLARQVGLDRMQRYLTRFAYGNGDLSAGLDQFWLVGDFAISADEKVEFLRRFYHEDLGISPRATQIVKEIMVLEEVPGYRLSGKTGTANLAGDQLIAWLVGYLERDGSVHFFALNLEGPRDVIGTPRWHPARRLEVVRNILHELEIGGGV